MEPVRIKLNPIEMTFIARLLGAKSLMFIGDPFYGWLSDEVKEAWQRARESLIEKGMAREIVTTGQTLLDVLPASAVAVCAAPKETFLLLRRDDGGLEELWVAHSTAGIGVIHRLPRDPLEELDIAVFAGSREVREAVKSMVKIEGSKDEERKTTSIKPEDFWRFLLAKAGKKEEDRGGAGNGSETEMGQLVGERFNLSLLLRLDRSKREHALQGIGFLMSGGVIWSVKPVLEGDSPVFEVTSVDEEVAERNLDALLSI